MKPVVLDRNIVRKCKPFKTHEPSSSYKNERKKQIAKYLNKGKDFKTK